MTPKATCPNGGVVGAATSERRVQISEDDEKRREGLVAKWEGKVSSDYKIVVSTKTLVLSQFYFANVKNRTGVSGESISGGLSAKDGQGRRTGNLPRGHCRR